MKKIALFLLLFGISATAVAVESNAPKDVDCSQLFTTAGDVKVVWKLQKQGPGVGSDRLWCATPNTCLVNNKPGPGCGFVGYYGGPGSSNSYVVAFNIYGQGWKVFKTGFKTADEAIQHANSELPSLFKKEPDKN